LYEAGLLDRATIFATDISPQVLQYARQGRYDAKKLRSATAGYFTAGGQENFSDYFIVDRDAATVKSFIKKKVNFFEHNLVCDTNFNEFEVVFCRNVLIYFGRELKNRVLENFRQCLKQGGFLCLGMQESLEFTSVKKAFEILDARNRLFQRQSYD
jgi:chemotaxis protein methyltransferase CheR